MATKTARMAPTKLSMSAVSPLTYLFCIVMIHGEFSMWLAPLESIDQSVQGAVHILYNANIVVLDHPYTPGNTV